MQKAKSRIASLILGPEFRAYVEYMNPDSRLKQEAEKMREQQWSRPMKVAGKS